MLILMKPLIDVVLINAKAQNNNTYPHFRRLIMISGEFFFVSSIRAHYA